ncbi:hypothetical protein BJV82DRAFT_577878 [Fennellomyces sp. T-0311]|nr:hypothetical protein BJV82DRAFT_577878 [Fennellomyces sp. T-0311]
MDFITTDASEVTETDVSTVTVIRYTTVGTVTITARNPKLATKTATTSYAVTTIDSFGVTSTTTTYTAMRTIFVPVPNQWPPVDEKNRKEEEERDKIKYGKGRIR